MRKLFYKFIIIVIALVAISGVYNYLSKGGSVQAANTNSSITSSASSQSPLSAVSKSTEGTDAEISAETSFLVSLISLTKIKIDTTLFASDSFNALVNNNVKLEPSPSGRPNPFAPIERDLNISSVEVSRVTTNPPIQVTDKTASLYGTINDPTGVTSAYFEYGPTPTLGKKTVPATQSLVGTFVTNVTGLSPKTVYFYRSVAKVGNTEVYGETISFFTN